MHLKITAADKTDKGRQRERNEDSVYKRVESTEEGDKALFIVADGMGGYKGGEVASRLAIETISKALDSFFKPLPDQPTIRLDRAATIKLMPSHKNSGHQTHKLDETPEMMDIEDRFKNAIQQANSAIVRHGEKNTSARGLGSTVTAMLLQDEQAYIANVGDSRVYILRDQKLVALTRDHSLVAKLIEAGQITPEEVYSHPQRNLIYRSLGAGHRNIEVDVFHQIVRPGDVYLLCSDGLWEMVRQQDIEKLLCSNDSPQKICERLIDLANQNGGEDNITAIVVHVSAV
jgi:protein phosphatase